MDPKVRKAWTTDEIRELGTTTDVETAGAILGVGRTLAYRLAQKDEFPVPLLRPGNRLVVPVAGLLRALGIELAARLAWRVDRDRTAADIVTYIDGAPPADLWSDLVLPRDIRAAWTPLLTVHTR